MKPISVNVRPVLLTSCPLCGTKDTLRIYPMFDVDYAVGCTCGLRSPYRNNFVDACIAWNLLCSHLVLYKKELA